MKLAALILFLQIQASVLQFVYFQVVSGVISNFQPEASTFCF